MPVRVELIDEAVEDLLRYRESNVFLRLLATLVRLEEVGKEAGLPLGRGLTGWRKIVVGDRNWRIVFTTNYEESIATVWVIGDREDSACYAEAQRRIEALPKDQPQAASLAAAMFQLSRAPRPSRRKHRPATDAT
jgi:mRNA interferase RelE/StbE